MKKLRLFYTIFLLLLLAIASSCNTVDENKATQSAAGLRIVAIEFPLMDPAIPFGTSYQFKAIGILEDATTLDITQSVDWKSTYPEIAKISNEQETKGLVTSVALGSTEIIATLPVVFDERVMRTSLKVTDAELTTIEITPNHPQIARGTTQQFTATGIYTDFTTVDMTKQVIWKSSDNTVVRISNSTGQEGLATGVGSGQVTIGVKLKNPQNQGGESTGINTQGVDKTSLEENTPLTPQELANLPGRASMTITDAELVSLSITPSNPTLVLGSSLQFQVTGIYSDNSTQELTSVVNWTTGETKVAQINKETQGLLVSGIPGETDLTVTLGKLTAKTQITVKDVVLTAISITPAKPVLALGTSQNLSATGIYSDQTTRDLTNAVLWSSSDPAIASVSNASELKGLLTGVKMGESTITATYTPITSVTQKAQPQNNQNTLDMITGKPITSSTVVKVSNAVLTSLSITPSALSLPLGTTRQIMATGNYSDQTTQDLTTSVLWSSANTAIASISNADDTKGLVTSLKSGETSLKATFKNLSSELKLTVTNAKLVAIAVTPTNPAIALGTTQILKATGTYTDNTIQDITRNVTWISSNALIATVSNTNDNQGLVTSVSAGVVTLKAALADISAATTLTITNAVLTAVAVTPVNPVLALGTSQQLSATGTYSDQTTQNLTNSVTWSVSDAAIVSASNNQGTRGLVSSLRVGQSTVTASAGTISGSTGLTVNAAVLTSLTIIPASFSVALGTNQLLQVTGTYSNNTTKTLTTEVTWSTSDPLVATISNATGSEGLMMSVGIGQVLMTARLGTVSANTSLTITEASLVALTVDPVNVAMALGTNQTFTATGMYTDNTTQNLSNAVTWSSSDTDIATISNAPGSQGMAVSIREGQVSITAALENFTGSTTLTISPAVLTAIAITPDHPAIALGTGQLLTATGIYSDHTTQNLTNSVTWSSASPSIAAVSNAFANKGMVTSVSLGQTTITATQQGISSSIQLIVTKAVLVSVAVTPTNPAIALGTSQAFEATGLYSDNTTQDLTASVTWSSADPSIANVSNLAGSIGMASSLATGQTLITASQGNISGSSTLKVTPAELVSLSVTSSHASISLGLSSQLTATGIYTDNSTQNLTNLVTWSSSEVAVASVSNAEGTKGLVTSIGIGETTLRAFLGSISGQTSLSVSSAELVSLAITPNHLSIALGLSQILTATGIYTDNSTQNLTNSVTWSSSNSTVVSVSNAAGSKGVLFSGEVGAATISAIQGSVRASAYVTVTDAALVSLSVTPAHTAIALGLSQQMTATGIYTDNSLRDLTQFVTWDSSDPAVGSISNALVSKGLLTSVSTGQITLTAAQGNIHGSTSISITDALLVSLTVTPANPTLASGLTQQMTVTGIYTDNSSKNLTSIVTWSSSNTAAASISNAIENKGLVLGVGTGESIIRARTNNLTGSTLLAVVPAELISISLSPANSSIALGLTQQITATGLYTDNSTQDLTTVVTWSSSNTAAATISNAVDSKGLVSSIRPGITTLTATQGMIRANTQLTVTGANLTTIFVSPTDAEIPLGLSENMRALGLYTDNTIQDLTTAVTWSSSNTAVAAISNASDSHGLVTSLSMGQVTLTAVQGAIRGSTQLSVTKATLVSLYINPITPEMALGTSLHMEVTGTYTDNSTQDLTTAVTWSVSNPYIANISNAAGSEGLVVALASGLTSLTAAYGNISDSTSLMVTAAALVAIAVTPWDSEIELGKRQQMTATGTYSDNSTQEITSLVTWGSSRPLTAAISNEANSKGVVTSLTLGQTNITATLQGVSGYTGLSIIRKNDTKGDLWKNSVICASDSLFIKENAKIHSGHLIVNSSRSSQRPELILQSKVSTPSGYTVQADAIRIARKALIGGDAYYNALKGKGVIIGKETPVLRLPVLVTLPPFQMAEPGNESVDVKERKSLTLAAGNYAELKVARNASVTFSGGVYHFESIEVSQQGHLLFTGKSEVRVHEKIVTREQASIRPTSASGIAAADIIFYVGGNPSEKLNGVAKIGTHNTIEANFYVPYGQLWLQEKTNAIGSFWAKNIVIGPHTEITLDSFYQTH